MQNIFRSTALSLLFSTALSSVAFAQVGTTIDGSQATVTINNASGTGNNAGVLFNTNDTPVDVTITGTVTGGGDESGIDLVTNEDNNVTLTIDTGAVVNGGAVSPGTSGLLQNGILGYGNDNLTLTIDGTVNGGDGLNGADDVSSPGYGSDGGNGVYFLSGVGGNFVVNGTINAGNGGDGGAYTGVSGAGRSGGVGGYALTVGNTGANVTIGDGASLTGGDTGRSGAGAGPGASDIYTASYAGVGLAIAGDNITVDIGNAQIYGGNRTDTDNDSRTYGGDGVYIVSEGTDITLNDGVISAGSGADAASASHIAGSGGVGLQVVGGGNTTLTLTGNARLYGGDAGASLSADNMPNGGYAILNGVGGFTLNVGQNAVVQAGANSTFGGDTLNGSEAIFQFGNGSMTIVNEGEISNSVSTAGEVGYGDVIQLENGSGHSITNSGEIISRSLGGSAIEIASDTALIDNLSGGSIIHSVSQAGSLILLRDNNVTVDTLRNAGLLSGADAIGVDVGASDTITTFINSGTIHSTAGSNPSTANAAVRVQGAIGSFTNSNVIASDRGPAVLLDGGTITTLNNTNTLAGGSSNASNGVVFLDDGGAITSFTHSGTIVTGGSAAQSGIEFSDDAGFITTLTNSGVIANGDGYSIDNRNAAGTGGILNYIQNEGATVTGTIEQTADHAYSVTINGGTAQDINLDSRTGNTFIMNGGQVDDINLSLGNGSATNTITLTGGTIGSLTSNTFVAMETITVNNTDDVNIGQGKAFATLGVSQLIDKQGSGALRFYSDINDIAGGTTLRVGEGSVVFENDLTLDGNIDANAGVVSLSNNILTVEHGLDFADGAVLETLINSTVDYGQLVGSSSNPVTATLNDGAVIRVASGSTVSESESFTVIDNDNFAGSALNLDLSTLVIEDDLGRMVFTPTQIGNTLVLTASQGTTGLTSEEQAVDAQLDAAFAGDTDLTNALDGISNSDFQTALNTVTPDKSGGDKMGSYLIYQGISDLVLSQTGEVSGVSAGEGHVSYAQKRKPRAWIEAFGQIADQDDKDGRNGYSATTGGLAAGMDMMVDDFLGDETRIGLSYGYGSGEIDVNNAQDESDIATHQLIAYGQTKMGGLTYDLQLGYGYNNYETSRNVVVGAVGRQARADFDGHQFTARLDVSKSRMLDRGIELTPTIGAEIYHLETDGYSERGAGNANLNVEDQDYTRVTAHIGAKAEKDFTLENGTVLTPSVKLGYSYDVMDDDLATTAQFSGGGGSFTTTGIEMDRSSLKFGAGLSVMKTQSVELSVNYDADIRDSYTAHNGKLNLRYSF